MHRIARQRVELRVDAESAAKELHAELSGSLSARLAPMLDEVFTAASGDGTTIRIDCVEIDLGVVEGADTVSLLAARTRERLRAVLQPAGGADTEPDVVLTGVRRLSDEEIALERIAVFLADGVVRWADAGLTRDELDATFVRLIASAPEALLRLLRRVAPERAARRIWLHVAPPARARLLAWLGATRPDGIERLVRDWAAVVVATRGSGLTARGSGLGARGSGLGTRKNGVGESPLPGPGSRAPSSGGAGDVEAWLFEIAWTTLLAERSSDRAVDAVNDRALRAALEPMSQTRPVEEDRPDDVHSPSFALAELTRLATGVLGAGSAVLQFVRRVAAPAAAAETAAGQAGASTASPAARDSGSEDDGKARHVRDAGPQTLTPGSQDARSRPRAMDATEPLWAAHAGLVIVWPFLPGLFEACGLVEMVRLKADPTSEASLKADPTSEVSLKAAPASEEKAQRRFVDDAARQRAVLLTAHLADGQESWGEHELLVEKLVCGHAADAPLPTAVTLTDRERGEAKAMLGAVLTYWTSLKSTSIDGLRQAFLRRAGAATGVEAGWKLEIARAGHDLLLDTLPWGIGLVVLPWMEQPLHVEW